MEMSFVYHAADHSGWEDGRRDVRGVGERGSAPKGGRHSTIWFDPR